MGTDVVKRMDIVHVLKVGKDTSACFVSEKLSTNLLRLLIALVSTTLIDILGTSELTCTTISGPDLNKTCIFPFEYRGVTYNSCTTKGNDPDESETKAWCSTKVNDFGIHIEEQGNWGICETKCQPQSIFSGKLKQFQNYA